MIKFTKPINLNGTELRDELRSNGIQIADDKSAIVTDNNGNLFLDISDKDEAKAQLVIAAHNGTIVAPELTIEDKLASVGLNLDDLKTALGL